jgi:hypothetical protein
MGIIDDAGAVGGIFGGERRASPRNCFANGGKGEAAWSAKGVVALKGPDRFVPIGKLGSRIPVLKDHPLGVTVEHRSTKARRSSIFSKER